MSYDSSHKMTTVWNQKVIDPILEMGEVGLLCHVMDVEFISYIRDILFDGTIQQLNYIY